MKTRLNKGIILMLACTAFTAIGQILLKKGTALLNMSKLSLYSILFNYSLVLGIFFYGIATLLLIMALRHGKLNVLYPIVSLTFVWVIILSFIFLQEPLSFFKVLGTLVILYGVFLITRHGK